MTKRGKVNGVVRKVATHAAAVRYGQSGRKVRIIAVVGDAGKTTTVQLIAELLRQADFAVLEMRAAAGAKRTFETDPGLLHRELRGASRQGFDYVVLEVHEALFDNPILETLDIETVVATSDCDELTNILEISPRHAIVPYGTVLPEGLEHHNVMTFGTDSQADMAVSATKLYRRGTEVTLVIDQHVKFEVATHLIGYTAALNVAAALATVYVLGVDTAHFADGVARLTGVPGNYQYIVANTPYLVATDQGVALEQVVQAARQLAKRRLLVALAREIDEEQLREIAKLTDRLVTTTDTIITEVESIADHEEAAYVILRGAKKDDLVLLIGPAYASVDDSGDVAAQRLVGHA